LFQRGAADGLNIVVPFGEQNYYRMRPSIAIPRPKSGSRGSGFVLTNPESNGDAAWIWMDFLDCIRVWAPLEPLFHKNQLAIVRRRDRRTQRVHILMRRILWSPGTPGLKATEDGWLNRAIESVPEEEASPFRAVAMGPNLPRMLRGSAPAIALPDVKQFKVMAQKSGSGENRRRRIRGDVRADGGSGAARNGHGKRFEAIDMLRKADPTKYQPENGADYPKSRLGQSLQQVGQLIKANIGVEVLFVDCGGWDNHVNEGGVQGQLSNLLKDLGQGWRRFIGIWATGWKILFL